jgi:hypothetical protein
MTDETKGWLAAVVVYGSILGWTLLMCLLRSHPIIGNIVFFAPIWALIAFVSLSVD